MHAPSLQGSLDKWPPKGNMDQYVIQIRKSKSRKNQDLIFGFLRETYDGHTSGSVRSATVYEDRESAENAAASFVLQNPTYMERVVIKKVEEHMPIHTRRK